MSHAPTKPIDLINLASERLGTKVLYANDDFFAPKENLIKTEPAVFIADRYTDRGKWMDGWESRRKRGPGHDFCVIRLGVPGYVHRVDIDTSHFLGNHPPFASLEGAVCEGDPDEITHWTPILPKVSLERGSHNVFPTDAELWWTHIRLNIYPDGGVARLRVYGKAHMDWLAYGADPMADRNILAMKFGAEIIAVNEQFFSPAENLMMPGRGAGMHDGWETRRRREPGFDWVIMKLPRPAQVTDVICDTAHFKGNYPDGFSLEISSVPFSDWAAANNSWQSLLPRLKLSADQEHHYAREVIPHKAFSYLRLSMYPDGGISRLRLLGTYEPPETLNSCDEKELIAKFTALSYSPELAHQLATRRPFANIFDLLAKLSLVWQSLSIETKNRALRGHPQLGDKDALARRFSMNEQKEIASADTAMLSELWQLNQDYLKKFGHIFIMCARGQPIDAMILAVRQRINNSPAEEQTLAHAEHAKIMKLRILEI